MPQYHSTETPANADGQIVENIADTVMETIGSLPGEFVVFDEEEVVFLINLQPDWIAAQSAHNLTRIFVTLYLMHIGDLWDKQSDPFDLQYVKELSKVDQAAQKKGVAPLYYKMIPESLKTKIKHLEPSQEVRTFIA